MPWGFLLCCWVGGMLIPVIDDDVAAWEWGAWAVMWSVLWVVACAIGWLVA